MDIILILLGMVLTTLFIINMMGVFADAGAPIDGPGVCAGITIFIALFWAWISIAGSLPTQYKPDMVLPIYKMDNAQYVKYQGEDGREYVTNLQKEFGIIVNDDTEVVLRAVATHWYGGIYWCMDRPLLLKLRPKKELERST